jgi:chromosome segregation ATPase
MHDSITLELHWMTCAIHVTRVGMERIRKQRQELMALELKGLKGSARTAAGHIDRLKRAYGTFNQSAGQHADDVEGLAKQIDEMQDDLSFATRELGNSVAASNGSGEVEEHHEQQKPQETAVQPVQPPSKPSVLPDVEFVEMHPSHQPGSPASSEPGH